MLNLHVLGTIIVDAGSRAASVIIQRVMDTEHDPGNVTGETMLNTLLDHWVNYFLSEPIPREFFEIRDFDVVYIARTRELSELEPELEPELSKPELEPKLEPELDFELHLELTLELVLTDPPNPSHWCVRCSRDVLRVDS